MRRLIGLTLCTLALPLPLFAQSLPLAPCLAADDARCAIDESSVSIRPVGPGVPSMSDEKFALPPLVSLSGPAVNIGIILDAALKIWDIIVKNKPVVDISTQYAAALPKGITDWHQLSGWNDPEGTIYGFSARNGFGQQVVDVRYLVTRTYGGSYKGKGKYLTAVTVEPLTVNVAWGYKLSLAAEAPEETIGNFGTDQRPVAGMQLRVRWSMETPLNASAGTSLYFMKGDGTFEEQASVLRLP